MSSALGEEVNKICKAFNESQSEVEVEPLFRGSYNDTLTSAIAAWRAGQAPNLVQIFEVGTASMLAAGPAVRQIWQLAQETGVAINPDAFIPVVRNFYGLPDGRLAAHPFNSSTAMMWINQDLFEKAGLDPKEPPATWDGIAAAAEALRTKAGAAIGMTTTWPTWIQLEQFGAIHDVPFATQANGFEGLDAQLLINGKDYVGHIQRLLDMAKAGTFTYGGRDSAAEPLFTSGQAAISFNSSGARAEIARSAQFRWAEAFLPYNPAIIAKPLNSIIGGASLWAMTSPTRTPAEYKGVAEFLKFVGQPDMVAQWSTATGFVPVSVGGFDVMQKQGFFEKNPGADLPSKQLTRAEGVNSRGIRLGRMPEIRNIIQEELEGALQGRQNAQQAMDAAVQRGNRVLREFQRTART